MLFQDAEEFYEIYKGVLGEYSVPNNQAAYLLKDDIKVIFCLRLQDMTLELSLGPCYALEIFGCSEDTPKNFRQIVGPHDPVSA